MQEVSFTRDDLVSTAEALGRPRPKNLGDITYSLRYRTSLPESILREAPPDREWAIFPGGNAVYTLRTVPVNLIEPRQGLRTIRLPDATPGVISRYSLSDEQALLALGPLQPAARRVHRPGLLPAPEPSAHDHHHQRHRWRAQQLPGGDRRPLRRSRQAWCSPYPARTGKRRLRRPQRDSDMAGLSSCWPEFPDLIARPVAAQFMDDNVIALFEFEEANDEITIVRERHYNLVPSEELTRDELAAYRTAAQRATS